MQIVPAPCLLPLFCVGIFSHRAVVLEACVLSLQQRPVKQVACGYAHTAALTYDGEVWTWGSNKGGCCGHHVGR
jgi:alpha-tubulin suppressor-like RCC1 family protein